MKKTPAFLHFSEKDALDVLAAQVLEQSASIEDWTKSEAAKATSDAKNLCASSDPQKWLPVRARLAASRMKEKGIEARLPRPKLSAMLPAAALICTTAYLLGVFSDKFATDGSQLNLLSPPLILFALWNVFMYAALAVSKLPWIGSKMRPPLRSTLLSLIEKIRIPGLKNAQAKKNYLTESFRLLRPKHEAQIAGLFHLASIFFLIGIASSILVRGVGTSYQVGWESTWFAGSPQTVRSILDLVYGSISSGIFGMQPIPGVEEIASMNFKADYAPPADAADWIARLLIVLASIVAVPRIFLASCAFFKVRRLERKTKYPVEGAYLVHLISDGEAEERILHPAFIFTDLDDKSAQAKLALIFKDKGIQFDSLAVLRAAPWDEVQASEADLSKARKSSLCAFLVDASSTPEDEVHGRFIDMMKSLSPDAVYLIADMSNIARRFGPQSPTYSSRASLWENFAASRGVSFFRSQLSSTDSEARE